MDDNYAYKRRYEKELAAGIIGQLGSRRSEPCKGQRLGHMRFDHQTIKEELIDPDQTSVVNKPWMNPPRVQVRSR